MNWSGARIASSSTKHSLTRWPAQYEISTATGWSRGNCKSRVTKWQLSSANPNRFAVHRRSDAMILAHAALVKNISAAMAQLRTLS